MTHSGGQAHEVGDRGQRYEITVFDHVHKRRVTLSWTDDIECARGMADGAELRPTWSDSKIHDRQAPGGAQEILR